MTLHKTLKVVASFEALKGLLALAAASGLLMLLHRDLHTLAIRLVEEAHLNPAAHYPGIFIQAAGHLQNGHLSLLALGAVAYAGLRFVEAYGLFRQASWAELLAALSGALYLPFEVMECLHRPDVLSYGLLLTNLLVVAVMVKALRERRRLDQGHNTQPQ
ncbi:DUF2127 domain-containing protein [Pseudaeromonas paramecii]|uniref:DUF2127 domain-containing protein n=1 Tax=Pseudaeromonas paramecii TaxID=2138166 RepID=A0ABP8QJN3_9GAMM